ncbi:MAG: hypothetical protein Q4G60_01185 [bacterium]|nr:hypothetical protein [bacterium]
MSNTATRAAKKEVLKEPHSEVVKVRMQGTEKGISAFQRIIEFAENNGLCEVQNFLDLFHNKGSDEVTMDFGCD